MDSTEVQSPINPPDDAPDHCPAPGDYAPIRGTTAWTWLQSTIESFISNPHEASLREDIGADHLTLDQLHPLLDATDAETCRQIKNKVPVPLGVDAEGQDRILHAYFQAGEFYFAVTYSTPLDTNEITSSGSIIHVYDENLNFLAGFVSQ